MKVLLPIMHLSSNDKERILVGVATLDSGSSVRLISVLAQKMFLSLSYAGDRHGDIRAYGESLSELLTADLLAAPVDK
jgi:hypothetical protein